MNAETWQRVSAIAEQALELRGDELEAFLDQAKADHPELADDIVEVVRAAAEPDEFASQLSERVGPILDSESFVRGERFGSYKIESTLGWGGMGAVYLAHRDDDQYEKTVALKVLPKLSETGASRERFLRERQTLARLEHPSIARLIDGGVTEHDQPYFVLEYVRGVTSSQFADADETTARQILEVFAQACDAVAFAHSKLVVHCDLKPSNVMVDESGRARLIDFGIAHLASGERLKVPLDYLETPLTKNYASPELLAREGVDTRSDIFSLGNLLHRLLTGRQRYQVQEDDNAIEIAKAASAPTELPATGKLEGLSVVWRRELAAIIARSTATDRTRRYQSVAELARDVRAVLDGRALSDSVPVRAYRLRKLVRRNPIATGLVSLTAVAIAAAIIVLVVSLDRTQRQRAAAEAAEQSAREAATTSQSIVDFLVSVFANADIGNPDRNGQLTARELVESALRTRQRSPLGDSSYAAQLDLALARVGVGVGALPEAKTALERALAGPLSEGERRAAMLQLALAYAGLGDKNKLDETIAALSRECGDTGDSNCLASAFRAQGHGAILAGDNDAAIEAFEKALEHLPPAKQASNERRLRRVATLFTLGSALHRAERFADAEPVFDEATVTYQELGSPPNADAARGLALLGRHRFDRADHAAARTLLEQALTIRRALHGDDHPEVGSLQFVLSGVHLGLGDAEQAVSFADAALASGNTHFGTDSAHVAQVHEKRAVALLAANRPRDAETAALAGLSIAKRRKNGIRANLLTLRLVAMAADGRGQQAVALARAALAKTIKMRGAAHLMVKIGRIRLAEILLAAGNADGAIRELTPTDEAVIKRKHHGHVWRLVVLARAHAALDQQAQAKQRLAEAAELAQSMSPPHPVSLRRVAAATRELARRAR